MARFVTFYVRPATKRKHNELGLTTGPNYERQLDVIELAGWRPPLTWKLMFSWRRSANLIPCAGKAAGDEETDDGVHNSGRHSHSRKKCGAAEAELRTGITAN